MIKVLVVIALMVFVVSCGHKNYVGMRVGSPANNWCDFYSGYYPAFGEGKKCTIQQGPLLFDFIIKPGEQENEYVIEGFIDASKGNIKSFDTLMEGRSRFFMLVADGDLIVDNVGFRPKTIYGSLGNRMPFRIEYHAPDGFSKITFGYKISVRG